MRISTTGFGNSCLIIKSYLNYVRSSNHLHLVRSSNSGTAPADSCCLFRGLLSRNQTATLTALDRVQSSFNSRTLLMWTHATSSGSSCPITTATVLDCSTISIQLGLPTSMLTPGVLGNPVPLSIVVYVTSSNYILHTVVFQLFFLFS